MEFKELQKEMIAAMKSGDKVRKNSISNLIAAIKKVAIDEGKREEIPNELVERVILKELKSAKEQIDTCPADRHADSGRFWPESVQFRCRELRKRIGTEICLP